MIAVFILLIFFIAVLAWARVKLTLCRWECPVDGSFSKKRTAGGH
jgi:hypothetical protein